jgi:molybdenum cofactor synthesis domain-containing protein
MARMQASTYPMVAIDTAIGIVLEHTSTLTTEIVGMEDALGRVLAETPVAADDMPPFVASAVDGYALIAGDGTSPRRVLAEVIAGSTNGVPVERGTAVRIMTGAPVPPGADAVIMVENVTERDGTMHVDVTPRPGDNIHPRGQDVTKNQEVLEPGVTLGPAEIGLLATVGHTKVRVFRRPVVAVLSTGDELVEPNEVLRPGAIRDSNRYTLMASARDAGAEVRSLGSVRDDEVEQEARIREGLRVADVVLTSGGVSVGSRDLIKPILGRMGTIHFGRVAFKPGKPTTFATVEQKLVFGLPGFPVSSLVSFEVFVRPALRKMQGFSRIQRPTVQVELEHDVDRSPDRPEYQRAVVRWSDGRMIARLTGIQRSSRLLSLVGANAFLRIDPGPTRIPQSTRVDALLLGEVLPANA